MHTIQEDPITSEQATYLSQAQEGKPANQIKLPSMPDRQFTSSLASDSSSASLPWDRSLFLGGSDMGAILGLSPYRSAVDVWLEKTQRIPSQADSLVLRFGQFAEDFVAQEYERATGFITHAKNTSLMHAQHPYLQGHVDRWVHLSSADVDSSTPSRILECKTTHPQQANLWGEPGSDQIPMAYYVQCAWYMLLANCAVCDVAVLIGNNDFRIYTLHQDKELENFLLETAVHFWEQHVLLDIAPEPKSEEDCRQLYRQSQVSQKIEATPSLIQDLHHYQHLQLAIKEKEGLVSDIKQRVMQTLGQSQADTLTYQGRTIATWKAPKPCIKTNYKQLELDHPEWLTPYQSTQENSRRLLIKELA